MSNIAYYTLDATFAYEKEDVEDPELEVILEKIVDHLYELNALDINVVADLNEGTFALSLIVLGEPGQSIETILGRGMGTVRAAIHACEASTPGWPDISDMLLFVKVTPARVVVATTDDETDQQPLASV